MVMVKSNRLSYYTQVRKYDDQVVYISHVDEFRMLPLKYFQDLNIILKLPVIGDITEHSLKRYGRTQPNCFVSELLY